MLSRRLTAIVCLFGWSAAAPAAAPTPLLFGVNEGTSGSIGFSDRQEKYKPLADYLAKTLKRPVTLESASDLKNLTKSLGSARYGLILVRPSHISAKAMLRDIGIGKEQAAIRNFRSQEAVGYAVEQKLSDVGVVISYSKVAKDWTAKGHRFLWESKKLPYWPVIGSPKLAPEEIIKIREALLKLDQGEDGQKILKEIGVKGFVPGDQAAYLDLLKWVAY